MIYGIGIDLIEINRFNHWHTYSDQKLQRIFSPEEISYCRALPILSAARFATRFAAREAAYKACAAICTPARISFLQFARITMITIDRNAAPHITIKWDALGLASPLFQLTLSLTHTATTAGAVVIWHN